MAQNPNPPTPENPVPIQDQPGQTHTPLPPGAAKRVGRLCWDANGNRI